MSRLDKKLRHKAKREAMRREARRLNSISPIKRLADAEGQIDCRMSSHFSDYGQASIYVFKRAAGLSGMACFLVDRGVVGLKDAYHRMNIDRTEFLDVIDRSRERGVPLRAASLDEARALVAGGVRWAFENGMRLPKDWDKTALLIGGVGNWAAADVSAFTMEFAGHPEDLRQRLISQPIESYLKRRDVAFIFNHDATYFDQEANQYVDPFETSKLFDVKSIKNAWETLSKPQFKELYERLSELGDKIIRLGEPWLIARGEQPSPELLECIRFFLFSTMSVSDLFPRASLLNQDRIQNRMIELFLESREVDRRKDFEIAMDQAYRFISTKPDLNQTTPVALQS